MAPPPPIPLPPPPLYSNYFLCRLCEVRRVALRSCFAPAGRFERAGLDARAHRVSRHSMTDYFNLFLLIRLAHAWGWAQCHARANRGGWGVQLGVLVRNIDSKTVASASMPHTLRRRFVPGF